MKKLITFFVCALYGVCLAIIHNRMQKDDGLKTIRLAEVTHSIFTRLCMLQSIWAILKTKG